MQTRNTANLKGVDLSHYQNSIDMAHVKCAGIRVVMLKASEGETTIDPSFSSLYAKAKALGMKAGAYHYLHVGGTYTLDPQVANFLAQLAGKQIDCKFAIDMEGAGYHGGTPATVTAAVLDFATKVTAKTGIGCVVYSNTDFIIEHFTKDILKLPLWIADTRNTNAPGENGLTESWTGFQYGGTSMGGCTVDLDEFTTGILYVKPVPAHIETVKRGTYFVHASPHLISRVYGTVKGGQKLTTKIIAGNWRQIAFNGKTGYVGPGAF